MPAKFSAQQVYSVIKDYQLTEEQAAAVEQASTTGPALVVAGAGSGKTELMAVRVLWLVANGIARPEQILGLTFTRKAAGELSKRIYGSLLKLRDSQMWPQDLEYDFTAPNISTYNSYANGLFRDNALAVGYEPDAVLLTEAAAYQLARKVIFTQGSKIDARLGDLDTSANSIVEKVLALAASMNDNLVSANQIEELIQDVFSHLAELPQKPGSTETAQYAYMKNELTPLASNPTIAKLAEAYVQEKHRQGFVDYSDQVAVAERAVREVPGVRERERASYSQVLLDEYQDTSYLQTRLLQNLFAKSAVFAVGDPNQSIYGWRGASAANLSSFFADFEAEPGQQSFKLSTSWRNPQSVLTLANELIGSQKVLELKPAEYAGAGKVNIEFAQDIKAEADSVADWFKSRLAEEQTAALLMRKRRQMPMFVEALEAKGLKVEVVGLGGLMQMPEVVDLVSALRVIHNPAAGSQLIRLLTGPRWRIGARDIDRLYKYASGRARLEDGVHQKQQEGLAPEDAVSLIDALDLLLDEKKPEATAISDVGLRRMKDAAELLRAMRQHTGLTLLEFVRSVEQELWLDVEVQANPRRKNPMAHLNAFAGIVAGYEASNNQPTLGGFLNWLEFADERERFEVPTPTAERGVVQVMTIHAAKGLEWDHVAVVNLIDGDFPDTTKGASGWLSVGSLPYPLRGDRDSLPVFNYQNQESQQQAKKSIDSFKDEVREHQLKEELRLMYVAVTRPKRELLLTGSYWKPANSKPRKPSRFIEQAAQFLGVELPQLGAEVNPLGTQEITEVWPLDPLGEKHRKTVARAQQKTLTAIEKLQGRVLGVLEGDQIQSDIDLLLAERDAVAAEVDRFVVPVRVAASRFKDFINNFEQVAGALRRPMPQPPYKQTRTGTLFHSWVEQHYSEIALVESADSQDNLNQELSGFAIEQLQQTFAKSRWANLTPVDVEREIQFTIGGNTFICKLDAVFKTEDGYEIVDWKTGKSPSDEADEAAKSLQLALYRLAYSKFANIPIEKIQVSFYFVAEDKEVRPSSLPGENEILQLWSSATARAGQLA